jgi:putative ABC transport system ATP-binding protein
MRPDSATDTAFVSASFQLLPMLTVEENVALPVRIEAREADPAWMAAVMRAVELDGDGSRRAGELSRGEQLRVALARALATRPATLVVDDPAGAVDSVTQQGALHTLRRVARELGVAVVLARGDAAEPSPGNARTPGMPPWGYPNADGRNAVSPGRPRRGKLR